MVHTLDLRPVQPALLVDLLHVPRDQVLARERTSATCNLTAELALIVIVL